LAEAPTFDRKSKLGRSAAKALARKSTLTARALADLDRWIGNGAEVAAE
jgi:hypothetical protein